MLGWSFCLVLLGRWDYGPSASYQKSEVWMTVGYHAKLEGAYCLQASLGDFKVWLLGSPLTTLWRFQGPEFNFLA